MKEQIINDDTPLSMILARNTKGIIAQNGQTPWHIPKDLKIFKSVTLKYENMLMGRKTFESLPKVLPGRKHYVLTRSRDKTSSDIKDVYYINNLDDAPKLSLIVIGGAQLFEAYKNLVDVVHLTTVYKDLPDGASITNTIFKHDFKLKYKCVYFERHANFMYEILHKTV